MPEEHRNRPDDVRRSIPRTDVLLALPEIAAAVTRLGHDTVKRAVTAAQGRARAGEIAAADVAATAIAGLPTHSSSLRPVINATGVLLHTNLGRAPLSRPAIGALVAAAGATDVELDLLSGRRAARGRGTLDALAAAVPDAEAVAVVNNGAAALVLAATALAQDREIVVSRGELVEIGDGFRIPDLIACTGAVLREVGTTNRTTPADYQAALGPRTGFVLKVHPSNFVVSGFTSSVPTETLAALGVPLVVDIGSGLLRSHPQLPDEPDAGTALRAGADLVTCSGDKLLGGPQCGLLLGRTGVVERLRRHPLARALRVDKLTLAALEASLLGPTPTARSLATGRNELLSRADQIAQTLRATGIDAIAVQSDATVGGGGAPGVTLPSAAVSLPAPYAAALRIATRPVVGRLHDGRCLLDLIGVPPEADDAVAETVLAVPH